MHDKPLIMLFVLSHGCSRNINLRKTYIEPLDRYSFCFLSNKDNNVLTNLKQFKEK